MRSAVAAAACAVALCGCGDDDDRGAGAGDRLSQDEYEERFREIVSAHAMFVAGLRAGADDAVKLVRALRAGDERRAEAMLDRGTLFEPATGQMIGRVRLELSEKGYDLGGVSAFP